MSGARTSPSRMVHVRTVPTAFHARVIAARLGAEGIVTELRGSGLGGPYPFGDVSVWVGEGDVVEAAELLMADEVESAFEPDADDMEPSPSRRPVAFGMSRRQLTASVVVVVALWAALLAHVTF